MLAAVLRRARTRGDLQIIQEAIEVALAHDLLEGPAPQQAVALLRRSAALGAAMPHRAAEVLGVADPAAGKVKPAARLPRTRRP
jgi:hypothetical protein